MAEASLKGYYLTRLYREGSDPFAVVTDLPRDQALAYCEKYGSHRRVGDGSGGQQAYLDGRVETENWLRESARAVGIEITRPHPIYFTLTVEDQKDMAPKGLKAISIPAEEANLACCSFTFGDSMGNRYVHEKPETAHPLQGAVLNAAQAARLVAAEGIPGDYIKGGRYFEVQMWAQPPGKAVNSSPAAKAAVKISSSLAP